MAYAAPRTWTPGEYPTAAQLNQDLRDNVSFLANPPACRVRRTTAQAINNNTETALTFDAERYDTDGMHSTSSNTSRITFNTAGLYTVGATLELAAATDYSRWYVTIKLNATTYLALWQDQDPGTASGGRNTTISTTYKFAAADYVELYVLQQNGAAAARNINSTAAFSPEFFATWSGLG